MNDNLPPDPLFESLPDAQACLRLDDQLCFALYSATSAIERAYRPLLGELGLTYPQYVVLIALWEGDNISVGAVGSRLALPLSGITPVLDRLEKADLIRRRRSTQDRRQVNVVLTDTGRALEQQATRAQHQVHCQTQLSPAAHAALRGELQALTRTLNQP